MVQIPKKKPTADIASGAGPPNNSSSNFLAAEVLGAHSTTSESRRSISVPWLDHGWWKMASFMVSMDWFKGTWKQETMFFYHEIWGYPVFFP